MNAVTSDFPLAANQPLAMATFRGELTEAFRRAVYVLKRWTARCRPFPVRHSNPDFVVIVFIAGDNDMTEMVRIHLEEMERGATSRVAVIAVTDEWTAPARVVEVSKGTRTVLEELGEINTGDPQVLATLLARALVSYPPATRFAIGFSDHGTGVFYEDEETAVQRAAPFARRPRWPLTHSLPARTLFRSIHAYAVGIDVESNDMLTNREAGRMFADAFAAAGRRRKVDLIFSDTCLNGMIEVATELEPFAHCTVASEEVEPSNGWDYGRWLSAMEAAAPADAETWGRLAVKAMRETYCNRPAEFPVTLSAIRSGNLVTRAFASLVAVAQRFGQAGFDELEKAHLLTYIFYRRIDCYDLRGFARHLANGSTIPEIAAAARALFAATKGAVIDSIALGDEVEVAAEGIAFWFPSTRESLDRTGVAYRKLRFDALTGWSAYLETYR